jgi:hypothetical protein
MQARHAPESIRQRLGINRFPIRVQVDPERATVFRQCPCWRVAIGPPPLQAGKRAFRALAIPALSGAGTPLTASFVEFGGWSGLSETQRCRSLALCLGSSIWSSHLMSPKFQTLFEIAHPTTRK